MDEYIQLQKTNDKISQNRALSEEDKMYCTLVGEKQILDEETIRKIDEHYAGKMFVGAGPAYNVTINLSYKCNLNCRYCYQKQYSSKEGKITCEDIPKIKEFIEKYNLGEKLNKITISGGEPLLAENIGVIQKILDSFSNIKFSLYTNGINIKKYAEAIDFARFHEIQISLDGYNSVISELSKSGEIDAFYKILDGIRFAAGLGSSITIICMMSHGIETWLEGFLLDLKNENILSDRLKIRICIPINQKSDDVINYDCFSFKDYQEIKKIVQKREFREYVELDSLVGFSRIKQKLFRERNTRPEGEGRICKNEIKTPMAIGPDGRVYWCICADHNNAIIGNYHDGLIYNEVLDKYKKRNIFEIDQCRRCDMRYICSSGCPHSLAAGNKEILLPACREFDNERLVDMMEEFVL